MSLKIKRTSNMSHILTCQSQDIIYSIEHILGKIQNLERSKTDFNVRLNKHREDVNDPKEFQCTFIKKTWL